MDVSNRNSSRASGHISLLCLRPSTHPCFVLSTPVLSCLSHVSSTASCSFKSVIRALWPNKERSTRLFSVSHRSSLTLFRHGLGYLSALSTNTSFPLLSILSRLQTHLIALPFLLHARPSFLLVLLITSLKATQS